MRPSSLGHHHPDSDTPHREALRRALDLAVALKVVDQYQARLADLNRQFGHSIEILEPAGNYNCFAYAFGLADHPDFKALVLKTGKTAVMNSAFAAAELARTDMVEITQQEAQPNDIVAYFSEGVLKHAARISNISAVPFLRSKWGPGELHAHGLEEVPWTYGEQMRFFRSPDPEIVLDRLYAAEGSA